MSQLLMLQGNAAWTDITTLGPDQTVTLTVLGGEVVKTVGAIGKMPFTEFSTLHAVRFLESIIGLWLLEQQLFLHNMSLHVESVCIAHYVWFAAAQYV